MNAVKHAYRAVKKKVKQFEFDGFSITPILGFIPFPAPQFKRKRAKHRSRSKRTIVESKASKDPVVDTLENLRHDAIEDGDYVTAFGSALAQNVYEKNKKDSRQTTL
jgi:hypothetical protein